MIPTRFRWLAAAALACLVAPAPAPAQTALQSVCTDATKCTRDDLPSAFAKLYGNDLFLQNLVAGRFNTLGAAALLNVGSVAGTVADGGTLTAETNRAQAAEGANAAAIATNTAAIAAETSRAQGVKATKAPLASPTFTGIPTVPTAALGTATTQAASTSFVAAAVAAGASGNQGVPPSRQVLGGGLATGGGDLTADRTVTVPKAAQSDVAAGTDDAKALTSYSVAAALGARAPLASPMLVGTPTAPTPTVGDSSTRLATTAYVMAGFLRGDAAGGYSDAVVAQFLSNLGLGPLTFCQCRLTYSSPTQLTLLPSGGNLIWINGAYRKIPAAGIAFTNTGLAANTTYYLYAYWTGTAVALEALTTGRATDATYGHQIKSGDATRTLIGGFATDGSSPGQFADSAARRATASWFNRRPKDFAVAVNPNAQTISGTAVALDGASTVFTWSDEAVSVRGGGYASNGQANYWTATVILIDGASQGVSTFAHSVSAGALVGHAPSADATLADGLHTVNVGGFVSGGTGTFNVGATGSVRS